MNGNDIQWLKESITEVKQTIKDGCDKQEQALKDLIKDNSEEHKELHKKIDSWNTILATQPQICNNKFMSKATFWKILTLVNGFWSAIIAYFHYTK